MANTADTLKSGNIVEVTFSGTGADWNHSTDGGFVNDMHITAISWHPSAENDVLVINEGGVDAPSMVHWVAGVVGTTPEGKQIEFGDKGVPLKPYIDISDCTFSDITATKIIFILE